MPLVISKIGPQTGPLLRNLFEHYVHDMSEWLDIDTKADGSYSFDTSKFWKREFDVYLAKLDGAIAGFAIAGSAAPWLGEVGGRDVHEFFVLRKFRRSGVGRQLAQHIWDAQPGEWLVRVFDDNRPAIPFWRNAVAVYTGDCYQEEQRNVKDRQWRFFHFQGVVRSAK